MLVSQNARVTDFADPVENVSALPDGLEMTARSRSALMTAMDEANVVLVDACVVSHTTAALLRRVSSFTVQAIALVQLMETATSKPESVRAFHLGPPMIAACSLAQANPSA